MDKSIFILPDGTELSSGVPGQAAIRSVSVTSSVCDGNEPEPGGCCAKALEAELFCQASPVSAGQTLLYYREGENGTRTLVGTYILEKPERVSRYLLRLTAFDHISLLDRDMTDWLEGLTDWPYSLYHFTKRVCTHCGLTLLNTELPNGSFSVARFSATGITGRQLIRWAAQASGTFCRATAEGCLEFTWFRPAEDMLGPEQAQKALSIPWEYEDGTLLAQVENGTVTDGTLTVTDQAVYQSNGEECLYLTGKPYTQWFYYEGSLKRSDYVTPSIDQVRICQDSEDVGASYPEGDLSALSVIGNPLLIASDPTQVKQAAQVLYERLQGLSCRPAAVTVPAQANLDAGDVVTIVKPEGGTFALYIMSAKREGDRLTLTATGSADRSVTGNAISITALTGQVMRLKTDLSGIRAENADAAGNLAALALNVQGISAQLSRQSGELGGVKTQLTEISQNADSICLSVKAIQEGGVDRVTTAAGYTFDENGLRIQKEGQQMENLLDNTGMYVTRSGETVLQANDKGVIAADVSVRNFLLVGDNSRFEDYSDGSDTKRTACFYIGG